MIDEVALNASATVIADSATVTVSAPIVNTDSPTGIPILYSANLTAQSDQANIGFLSDFFFGRGGAGEGNPRIMLSPGNEGVFGFQQSRKKT